jgi:hypothetical protein
MSKNGVRFIIYKRKCVNSGSVSVALKKDDGQHVSVKTFCEDVFSGDPEVRDHSAEEINDDRTTLIGIMKEERRKMPPDCLMTIDTCPDHKYESEFRFFPFLCFPLSESEEEILRSLMAKSLY